MISSGTTKAGPLAGVLVVDFSQGIAGPYAARLLADQGARVLKVEPPAGDWMRQLGPGPDGSSANAHFYNLGKEGVALDLKDPRDRDRALALAARADVVVESARPGVMVRLGLGFEAVKALNPGVIYLSISGYGQTGPRATEPLTDTVAQARSGWMSINRGRDGIPHKVDTTIIDAVTGLYAFQAASMALWPGDGPRAARHVDVSLMQSAAAVLGPKIMETAHLGHPPHPINPPAGSYATSDGWIAVTLVREEQFRAMAVEIGEPGLLDDPRFTSFANRTRNLPALLEIVAARLAEATTAEWVERLNRVGMLAAAIHEFTDWLEDPQVVAIGAAPPLELAPGAALPVPHLPGQPAHDRPAPQVGEHTAAVLSEFGIG